MSKPYLIVGLGSRGVQPRLEIRDLKENKEQFTLFIHALREIQRRGYTPEAARFKDLGIVSLWVVLYPNSRNLMQGESMGYLTNVGAVILLRLMIPYRKVSGEDTVIMALFSSLRGTDPVFSPSRFWDWTDPRGETEGLPAVLRPQVFQFTLPDGSRSALIENPLAFYNFGSILPEGFTDSFSTANGDRVSYFKGWSRTYRRPSSNPTPIEDYVEIDTLMRGDEEQLGSVRQLRNQVGGLFCYPTPDQTAEHQRPSIWDEFSNTYFQRSIEAPHNTVHNLLGGSGTMADPDYAGFDPIFYLHHCNVDRILAFWEFTYNKFWVGKGYYKKDGDGVPIPFVQRKGTWAESDGFKVDQSSPLQPYRSADNVYWTPERTRWLNDSSTFHKGYTYPDIFATVGDKKEHVRLTDPLPTTEADVRKCKAVLQSSFGLAQPKEGKVDHGDDKQAPGGTDERNEAVPNYRRFYVFIELVEHAFGGSYSMEIVCDGKAVATFAVFARGDRTQCAACKVKKRSGGLVRGFVDLPDGVVDDIIETRKDEVLGLEPSKRLEAVARIIKESFTLRLVGASGEFLAESARRESHDDSGQLVGAAQEFLDESAGESHDDLGRGVESGVPLDTAIVPKVELQSCRATKRSWTGGRGDPEGESEISFFDHVKFGKFLPDGHQWQTA
ncbi:hypothetical protein EST38_g5635 [Candolleomyces aberdarensis]|uniref:tyrosinase n=1 Tax=Candolleomyces aberdarensis TaxID=2316362 RepID=A0A4Q2DLU8_9AGAR|nr:hypothetical protein EST38_g5635 [Candolleomyces aberdarensis]